MTCSLQNHKNAGLAKKQATKGLLRRCLLDFPRDAFVHLSLEFSICFLKPWWLSLLFSRNVFCVTLWCDSLKSLRGVEGSLSYSTFSSRGTAAPARKKIIWNYWSSWKRLQSHSWQSRRELQHRVNERPFFKAFLNKRTTVSKGHYSDPICRYYRGSFRVP